MSNLTFRQFADAKNTIVKVIKSNLIQNYKDAMTLSVLDKPAKEAELLHNKGIATIIYKYGKLAEKRDDKEHPGGYNSVAEAEAEAEEKEEFLAGICPVAFAFKKISQETIDILFEGTPEVIKIEKVMTSTGKKLNNITSQDLGVLKELGMLPK